VYFGRAIHGCGQMITDFHAKLFANELLRRCSADSVERIPATLMGSQVDLNPHQVDAALFAFRSPLSKGAILADEVGLGKTVEAGIVLSQKWAERKRKILIVLPSSLRKQWYQELQEKFYLPSEILEAKSFNKAVKEGDKNPFESSVIVICSYHFARNKADYIRQINWDLVVMDEAHRPRNVYKSGNRIARQLRDALAHAPKILLTATPLQNSLLELYGLASFIDEHTFGDLRSFRSQFTRITSDEAFDDLKRSLQPICKRTLRRQVLEYIRYTARCAHTEEFTPSEEEETLYDLVSDYLRTPNLQALPNSQRTLITLILRKLLASSTFAIAGALESLANKLARSLSEDNDSQGTQAGIEAIAGDFERFDELLDETDGEVEERTGLLSAAQRAAIRSEMIELRHFVDLAMDITENAKGQALLKALEVGFRMTAELGGAQKAIIFTESRRTQNYLIDLLSRNGYGEDLVLFNGTNADEQSRAIYAEWKARYAGTDQLTGSQNADTRAALVGYFGDRAKIMIATEAAAEGINLQFCSLVVNYDLPWNPQRIEQRIGRCHRYGQQHDVVVEFFEPQ
jgi:SNF2 family DNA or RNA helicase